MSPDRKTSVVVLGMTVVFLGLAVLFWADVWGRPAPVSQIAPVDSQFTNTATVRLSAADLFRTDGDTSGFSCYACHEENKEIKVTLDEAGNVVLPEMHSDLVMRHGRSNRNDHCFNCHDAQNLELLRTRDGRQWKFEQSSNLCGSCHGPTYRDWELGIHGRRVGYWLSEAGEAQRADCTSCHDPHNPAFPSMKPGPGPHGLREAVQAAVENQEPEEMVEEQVEDAEQAQQEEKENEHERE